MEKLAIPAMVERAKAEGYGEQFQTALSTCTIANQDEENISVTAPNSMDEATGHWLVREIAYFSKRKSFLFQSKPGGWNLCDDKPKFPNGGPYA